MRLVSFIVTFVFIINIISINSCIAEIERKEFDLSELHKYQEKRDEKTIPMLIDVLRVNKIGYTGEGSFMGYENREAYNTKRMLRREALRALYMSVESNPESSAYFEDIIPVAIEGVKDTVHNARWAKDILQVIGPSAVPSIIEVLKNQRLKAQVRRDLIMLLDNISGREYRGLGEKFFISPGYIPDLVEMLRESKDLYSQTSILKIFREMENSRALGLTVPVLLEKLENAKFMTPEEKKMTSYKLFPMSVFQALLKVEDEEALASAIPVVVEAMDGRYGETAQRDSVKILAHAGKYGVSPLIECWKTNRGGLGAKAGTQLAKMGLPAVEALIEVIKDSNVERQKKTVSLLLEIKDKKAIPILINALDEKDKSVRKNILFVLQKLTGKRIGSDSRKWRNWWEKEKDIFEMRWQ
ncbi:MAG: HEAT repeat domain-containing protein [Candidatus Omnitrophota bacterium]|nr:MAG: HEAT repeat domain-containing protein [Candidatus Omnitrophota bacterium]